MIRCYSKSFNQFLAEKFEVATVENGLEVMEAAKKFSPNIILLDLIIPGIDGFAVLKTTKGRRRHQKYSSCNYVQFGHGRRCKIHESALGLMNILLKPIRR